MQRVLLLTNADAGGHGEEAVAAAAEAMRSRGADVEVVATSGPEDLRAALGDREGRDIVVAGGDGSLHAVVATLHALGDLREPVVGLVPLGTGNDFARGCGIPLETGRAAAIAVDGPSRPVDILVGDGGRIVVNAVHIGVGVEAGERAAPFKKAFARVGLGVLGYAVGAVLGAVTSPRWMLRVDVDGDVMHDGPALQVGIANGATIGGGAQLAPGADPADGRAQVVVSRAVGRLSRLRYGWALSRGRHERDPDVTTRAARQVVVRATQGTFRVNADGELSGETTERTWTVLPGALTMRLPG